MSKKRCIIVWFRNDLRVTDNEILTDAIERSERILPVYVIDEREYITHTGQAEARRAFNLQSAGRLRLQLQELGGNLLMATGKPEEVIPRMAATYGAEEVVHHREVGQYYINTSAALEARLWKERINLKHIVAHTLYNKEALPFPIKDIPENFTRFRKKVEREAQLKPVIPAPAAIKVVPCDDWGAMPEIALATPYAGGAVEARNAVAAYITAMQEVTRPKQLPEAYLSPWITNGCISPREVRMLILQASVPKPAAAAVTQVITGLLWRDYYRFMLKKHGEPDLDGVVDTNLLAMLASAATGTAEVDEVLHQLNNTHWLNFGQRVKLAQYILQQCDGAIATAAEFFAGRFIDYSIATTLCTLASLGKGWHDVQVKGVSHQPA